MKLFCKINGSNCWLEVGKRLPDIQEANSNNKKMKARKEKRKKRRKTKDDDWLTIKILLKINFSSLIN